MLVVSSKLLVEAVAAQVLGYIGKEEGRQLCRLTAFVLADN
jgi:hypothetical protein